MDRRMKKKLFHIIGLVTVASILFSGCGSVLPNQKSEENPYKDFIVVDVFDTLANYQGIQSGWFAEIVKKKFNMELNIIAPNIAGGGDTLFQIRTASGNVGDLIICGTENGNLKDLVDEGLVLDMKEMLKGKDIMRYGTAITLLNDKLEQDGIYAIPSEISTQAATKSSEGLDLVYSPYLRWDVYSSIGYPKMSTLEDLLPVLKAMQDKLPYTEGGNKTYGFSFFKDWDGNMMNAAKQPACFYGYDEIGFVLAKADGSDYQSIIDENSLYMRNLKLYFEANQMGLVDPDSPTQNFEDVSNKYKDGSILYSPWPWLGQPDYNTLENKAEGKGYMMSSIDDMKIFSYGCNVEGNQKTVIAIGSQAEDPERLADFIDWLYSPEGIQAGCAGTSSGTAGPQGLTWEMGDEGPYLTEYGTNTLLGSNNEVPEEWGGGHWDEGVSQLNYKPVAQSDLDPNGYPYYFNLWDSVIALEKNPLDIDWQSHMDNAVSPHEYLENNNKILVAPGSGFVTPEASSEITTMRIQCRSVIVDYSWKMVFAQDEATFYSLLNELQQKVRAFGYEEVYAVDLENAYLQDAARKEAATLYGE
jgi:putative aldouronate transport system substrate-binding protein